MDQMSSDSNLIKNSFSSSDGIHKIAAYIWTPVDAPVCGIVQIVHGMREHIGRYADLAAFLNTKGYVVCGHDSLGHGESAKSDGSYGHFGDVDGAKYLVRDCRRMTKLIRKKYPNAPVFLLGHSMGSFIGRIYITRYAKNLAGFICVGTGGDNPVAPFGRTLAWGISHAGFDKKPGNLLDKMAFGTYKEHYPHEESKMAWLSRDADVVKAFDDDEHTKGQFTYGGFRDLLDLQMAVSGRKWIKRVPKELPILLISGTEDPVGKYGKSAPKLYERLKAAGVANVSCKLYMGARHEVLNEINKEEVYYDIYCWIEENKMEKIIK